MPNKRSSTALAVVAQRCTPLADNPRNSAPDAGMSVTDQSQSPVDLDDAMMLLPTPPSPSRASRNMKSGPSHTVDLLGTLPSSPTRIPRPPPMASPIAPCTPQISAHPEKVYAESSRSGPVFRPDQKSLESAPLAALAAAVSSGEQASPSSVLLTPLPNGGWAIECVSPAAAAHLAEHARQAGAVLDHAAVPCQAGSASLAVKHEGRPDGSISSPGSGTGEAREETQAAMETAARTHKVDVEADGTMHAHGCIPFRVGLSAMRHRMANWQRQLKRLALGCIPCRRSVGM
jgi:hypothetical protein